MELKRIKYFVAVAETLHFGRAADRLSMSQPPLSEQIRQLEEELGFRLFERSTRGAELTEAGQVLYMAIQQGQQTIDMGVRMARLTDQGQVGCLSIGFISSTSVTLVPQLVRHLARCLPRVELQLRQYGGSRMVENGLADGAIDLGLVRPPIAFQELACARLLEDAILCALPESHSLAHASSIQLESLADESFIMFSMLTSNNVNTLVQQVCAAAHFTPKVAQYVDDVYAMVGLVAAELGVALVPHSMARLAVRGVAFVPLADAKQRFMLSLAWRSDEHRSLVHKASRHILELFQSEAYHL